ncbi:MAG: hypothetical protein V4676_08970 [Bacteroidota bacterium]
MTKTTLQFEKLPDLAKFSKALATGFLLNTNKYTLTAKLSNQEIEKAVNQYNALLITTTDKVFTY